jgi:ABC-type branched-subunit amino acid transport system permease subunit
LIAALGDWSGLEPFHPADAILVPIAQVAVFASAVAMLCLTRHAIYAAILSIAFMYCCMFLVLGAWYVAGLVGWSEPQPYFGWQPRPIEWQSALITSCVAGTVLAWLSMRYDWGHKSRY